jgi:hypothetical protein
MPALANILLISSARACPAALRFGSLFSGGTISFSACRTRITVSTGCSTAAEPVGKALAQRVKITARQVTAVGVRNRFSFFMAFGFSGN